VQLAQRDHVLGDVLRQGPQLPEDSAEAERHAREAIAILRRHDGRDELLARALLVLASTLRDRQRYGGEVVLAETEAVAREALAVAVRSARGKPSPQTASAGSTLAVCLLYRGRAEEAKLAAARAVELHRLVHGDRHPETAHGLLVLGLTCRVCHEVAEAERAYREALAVFRRAHGEGFHLWTVNALAGLVTALDLQYRDAEADAVVAEYLAA
jgi:hypothetical protein